MGCWCWCCATAIAHKARILDVVYNASNNELVRTKTLVKSCIVQVRTMIAMYLRI